MFRSLEPISRDGRDGRVCIARNCCLRRDPFPERVLAPICATLAAVTASAGSTVVAARQRWASPARSAQQGAPLRERGKFLRAAPTTNRTFAGGILKTKGFDLAARKTAYKTHSQRVVLFGDTQAKSATDSQPVN